MRVVFKSLALSLILIFCLSPVSAAQQAGRIESMKLLTADVGWAATNKKLFWTTDGGAQWKDITPKLDHKRQMVSSVFFLDPSTGWVLLSCGDDRDPIADDVCFEFAATTNAGESWSVVHPKIVDPVPPRVITEDGQGFSGTTFLSFADSQHGWAILKRNLALGRSAGVMLRTVDGGRTWVQLPKNSLPMADNLRFVTTKDGWLAGGGQPESDLYVTHDGGDSWSQVVIEPPAGVRVEMWPPAQSGVWPSYRLPFFGDPKLGFLIGSYWYGSNATLVLFSTTDLGRTWKSERALPNIDGVVTIVGDTLFAVSTQQKMDKLTVTRLPLVGKAATTASMIADIHGVPIKHYNLGAGYDALDMVDGARGWLLADELLATLDGGATWIDITPGGPSHPTVIQGETQKKVSLRRPASPVPTAVSGLVPATSNVSTHLGFDKSHVPCPMGLAQCTVSQSLGAMQAWMNSSPFYDVYIYLPNSPNRHNDPILGDPKNGPAWVSGVEAQGWGIGPIWFGLQSSCIINQPQVTQYFGVNGADPNKQGKDAADQAVAQDKLLGITSGIIWLNIENYTTGGACSTAAQGYVAGFVSEIGVYPGYTAGVYANPNPITKDISQVKPAPAAIWITKTPPVTNPIPSVTIWNQGISDNPWPNGQRMHQFLIDKEGQGVTWGKVSLDIDYDINHGPVVNANNGSKNYSTPKFSSYNYPGAIATFARGINDIWGNGIINGPNEVGQIVGSYSDSSGVGHGFLFEALAQFSTIDYPGQLGGGASGINNSGQIVGTWIDSNHCSHGYLYTGGSYISYDNPNAICAQGGTGFTGINDAGQISGIYYTNTGWQSFLYYKGKYYLVNYPGATYTNAGGINGDGMITGTASPGGGFVESPIPPSWTGAFSSFFDAAGVQTFGQGINNNGDVAGYYEVQYLDDFGLLYTNNVQLASFQYPTNYDTYAYGVNDFGQIIGYSNQPGVTPYTGFSAVPQP